MEKVTNKNILKLVSLCILLIVPFLKFFSMNLEVHGIITIYDFINPAIVLYVSIPFLIFVYIKDIIDSKRKLDICDYIFYILILAGILSTVFSINKNLAIFGKDFRHEGFLSILSYYLLFINWKINGTKDDIKSFIKLLTFIAIINSIYALFQIYFPFNFIVKYANDTKMASGMCGNPNFFGSLIVTVISIITCKYLTVKDKPIKSIMLIILLFISLINCQSTGPFLTFIVVFIFLLLFLCKKRYLMLKRIFVLIITLIITYIAIYFVNMHVFVNKFGHDSNRCELCELKETFDSGGSGRIDIWKNSLDIVANHFIIGVGFDNFYLAYPNPKVEYSVSFTIENGIIKREEPNSYYIVDNAHNVYLHTLVSTGIIGLIPYLLLCLLTFINGLKSKDKLVLIIFSGFVAYSVQAFANISVIQVAPIYYIIIGLILSQNNNQTESLT